MATTQNDRWVFFGRRPRPKNTLTSKKGENEYALDIQSLPPGQALNPHIDIVMYEDNPIPMVSYD
jgi:hypothetical protein